MFYDEERRLHAHESSSFGWKIASLIFIGLSILTLAITVEYLSRGLLTATIGLWLLAFLCRREKMQHDKEIILLKASDDDSLVKLTR